MSPSGVHLNKPVVALILGVAVSVFLVYKFGWPGSSTSATADSVKVDDKVQLKAPAGQQINQGEKVPADSGQKEGEKEGEKEVEKEGEKEGKQAMEFPPSKRATWHKKDFKDIPVDVLDKAKSATVVEKTVDVMVDNKKAAIFCRQGVLAAEKPRLNVLLLHGQAFTSKNWQDIGTLQFLAGAGYNPVAVDLPEYGQSKGVSVTNKGSFIEALIKVLGMTSPVIVSPSMSGTFSMPFLFDPGALPSNLRSKGFIPVAPVGTSAYKRQMSLSEIPAMIISGDGDKRIGPASLQDLNTLPNGEIFIIENAGHAAYMNQPQQFHQLIYNFLLAVTAQ